MVNYIVSTVTIIAFVDQLDAPTTMIDVILEKREKNVGLILSSKFSLAKYFIDFLFKPLFFNKKTNLIGLNL